MHLTYIPSFTDLIDPYYTKGEEKPKTLLERISTPSHISVSDDEDTIHPGEGWHEYNAHNPRHYPLVFVNEDREEEVAKFIRYHPTGDGITLQGKRSKFTPTYGAPLHARPFPHVNFNGPIPRDTDLAIFHPSAPNRTIVDDALLHLGDAGVIADVHTLRDQHLHLATIRQQRIELGRQELKAEEKKNEMERYLAHAAVRTRLAPHLVRTRPRSPPSSIIPRIFAAQGPPDNDPAECEGEDSLECRRVKNPRSPPGTSLGKRKRPLPPHIYCLKCHSENPGHETSDCPYDRCCRYCWSEYHRHHECPAPHLACSTTACVVPLTHRHIGTVCATSLVGGDDSYEARLAAGDYDGDMEGFTTD